MIKGEYNLQDTAFVDCNFAYKDISNIIHEYMHQKLETSTIFGIVNFMLEQSEDTNISKISELFKKVSLIVNENYATFYELASIKYCDKVKYNDFIEKFKKGKYYKTFYGKKILGILNDNSIEDLMKSNIINRIAFMSMNIDVNKFNKQNLLNYSYIESQFNKDDFNPNERYIKLLKTLEKLLKEKDVIDITDDMILAESGIEIINNSKKNFLNVLNLYKEKFEEAGIDTKIIRKNISKVENVEEDKFILTNATQEDIDSVFDTVKPMLLNENYETLYPEKIENKYFKCSVMRIMLYDDKVKFPVNAYAMVVFFDVVIGKEYIFFVTKECIRELINRFDNSILIFSDDYKEIINNFPIIKNRMIFLEVNNSYLNCKDIIKDDISNGREVMIHTLNNGVFFLFVKQKDGNVFVMYFFNEVMKLIKKDIDNKYFKQILVDDTIVDNCFYLDSSDWYKYEDVMRSITGTYIMDMQHKFEGLGHRTFLES